MIIILTMKNNEIIRVKTDKDFVEYTTSIIDSNKQWIIVWRENGTKAIFRVEDLKYITHE